MRLSTLQSWSSNPNGRVDHVSLSQTLIRWAAQATSTLPFQHRNIEFACDYLREFPSLVAAVLRHGGKMMYCGITMGTRGTHSPISFAFSSQIDAGPGRRKSQASLAGTYAQLTLHACGVSSGRGRAIMGAFLGGLSRSPGGEYVK